MDQKEVQHVLDRETQGRIIPGEASTRVKELRQPRHAHKGGGSPPF